MEGNMNFRDENKEMIDLCFEVQKLLRKNFHPHTHIVIDFDCIRVGETTFGLPTEFVEKDKNF